jgi:phosphotransferase system  glucose/maltose/N-acetylglucosamine-specific IIC component
MTTLLAVIDRISFLAAWPSVVGLCVALSLLLVAWQWQVHALGMGLLYFFVALLQTRVIRPEVALVNLLIGLMIAFTLYLTGRYLTARQQAAERTEEEPVRRAPTRFALAAGMPLRALILLAVLIAAVAGYQRFPLPQVPTDVGLACELLAIGGLFLMGLSEEPFHAGLGLLTFLAGFGLFFGALESSLVVVGLLGTISFLVALAVTFLAVTHVSQWEEER